MIEQDSSANPGAAGWMLLRADTLRLLLPIEEVGAAEHLGQVPQPTGQPGLFEAPGDASTDGVPRFAAALSERMQPLADMPAGRFIVTPFPAQPGVVLAWDEARLLRAEAVQLQPLPEVMCAPESPLRQFAEIDGEVAFAASADQLLGYAFAGAV